MPLKITNIKHPASTNTINKWADDQEATSKRHENLIQQLQTQINELKTAKK